MYIYICTYKNIYIYIHCIFPYFPCVYVILCVYVSGIAQDFGHGTGLIQEVTQALGDAPIDLVCQPKAEKPGRNGGFMVEKC